MSVFEAAAGLQLPMTLTLADLLIKFDPATRDANGWDALVWLTYGSCLADPQATDLFLSAGCRTDLDGCDGISDEHRLRFNQILKEHAQWKEKLGRISAENSPTGTFYGPDWGR